MGEEEAPKLGREVIEEALPKKPMKIGEEVGVTPEGYIVVNNEGDAFSLPPAVYALWMFCDGEKTVKEISAEISNKSEMPLESVEEAVVTILNALANVNLISWK